MSGNLRREALNAFKKLHRTRLKTFEGDDHALKITRKRINDDFKKNKDLTDTTSIQECIKLANDVEHEVRTTIIQLVEKSPGKFRAKITEDTVKLDNAKFGEPFNEAEFKRMTKCCGGSSGSPKKKSQK